MSNNLPVKKNGFIETIKNFFRNLFKKKKIEEVIDATENLNTSSKSDSAIDNQKAQDEWINKYKANPQNQPYSSYNQLCSHWTSCVILYRY